MKIIYAGTPDFAVPALQALIDSDYEIVAVYTQPDRPAGRGRKLHQSPVKALALDFQIPVEQPVNFKDPTAITQLKHYNAQLMIVAAYGLILPPKVLECFEFGCINIHASLLPRWRGAAPIQRAILAGDKLTGITIMQMEKGLDTGPYFTQQTCEILPDDTGARVHDRLAQLGATTLMHVLPAIVAKSITPQKQNEKQATYAHKLEKAHAKINWHESAELIERKIRAFNAWPVAFCDLNSIRIRIWAADYDMTTELSAHPGELISLSKESINIACGEGVLNVTHLQFPGGKVLPAHEILNAKKDLLKIGVCFS